MTNGFVWRGVPPPVFDRVDVDGEVPVGWGQSCRVGTAHRSRDGGRCPPYKILDSRVVPGGWRPSADPNHSTSHSNPRRKSPWFPISPHHSLFVQRLCVAPGGRVLLSTIEVRGVGVPGIVNCGVDWWVRGVPFFWEPVRVVAGVETHGVRRRNPWHPEEPIHGREPGFRPPPHLWGRAGVGGLRSRHGVTEVLSQSRLPAHTLLWSSLTSGEGTKKKTPSLRGRVSEVLSPREVMPLSTVLSPNDYLKTHGRHISRMGGAKRNPPILLNLRMVGCASLHPPYLLLR
jgi:hypothetical protein